MSNEPEKRKKTRPSDAAPSVNRIPFSHTLKWVSASLTKADKEWLLANMHHSLDVVLGLVESLGEAHSLAVKFEDKSGRYLCTVVCTDTRHPAAGCAISLRGSTAFNALYAMAYVLSVRDGDGWYLGAGSENSDPWG